MCAAALGALAGLGEDGGEVLLEELRRRPDTVRLARACVRALGACRYLAATEDLIALLEDPELGHDAVWALERLSGRRWGDDRAAWVRWWAAQSQDRVE